MAVRLPITQIALIERQDFLFARNTHGITSLILGHRKISRHSPRLGLDWMPIYLVRSNLRRPSLGISGSVEILEINLPRLHKDQHGVACVGTRRYLLSQSNWALYFHHRPIVGPSLQTFQGLVTLVVKNREQ